MAYSIQFQELDLQAYLKAKIFAYMSVHTYIYFHICFKQYLEFNWYITETCHVSG